MKGLLDIYGVSGGLSPPMVEPRNPIIADADTGHGGITATMKSHVGRWGDVAGGKGSCLAVKFYAISKVS